MAPLFSLLRGIYYGTTPAALRGVEPLYKQARKQRLKGVTMSKVQAFLETQPIYTRNKRARRLYARNPITANYPGDVVQVLECHIPVDSH